jgi:hypothetical protein
LSFKAVGELNFALNTHDALYTKGALAHARHVMKRGKDPVMQWLNNCLFLH